MTVKSPKPYVGIARDTLANFQGNQIVYACWDQHLMLAAPFICFGPPSMPFGELVSGSIAPLLQADPDAAAIDWHQVQWLKSNQPWTPDFQKSLAENGIAHKDQIRFRTTGANTLNPAAQETR
jgi:phenol/toluene 2-monooxygenase (NADH) P4/A4